MTLRRAPFLLGFLLVVAGAGCASSGSQGGAYGMAGGLDDCANLYPPLSRTYPIQYYPSGYDDDLCSAYPRVEGYYPEYVVLKPSRQVIAAEAREHRGHVVRRGEPQDWGSRFGTGSSDSSSSSSSGSMGSGGGGTVPRMEPIPVNSPSPAASSPGTGTVTVQPREH